MHLPLASFALKNLAYSISNAIQRRKNITKSKTIFMLAVVLLTASWHHVSSNRTPLLKFPSSRLAEISKPFLDIGSTDLLWRISIRPRLGIIDNPTSFEWEIFR